MDNQTNNILNQPLINPNPTPAPEIQASPLTRLGNWINTHRKLALIILIVMVILGVLIFTFFPTIKNKFFNKSEEANKVSDQPETSQSQGGSMIITSPKSNYALNEKIPVSVRSSTSEKPVTAFDIAIEYDPAFLTLSAKKPPFPLQDFQYYGKDVNQVITVSAIQKSDSQTPQIFKDTNLLDMEFSAKKAGKTILKMFYTPNATNDSNLLDPTNKDILSTVRGLEITIQ